MRRGGPLRRSPLKRGSSQLARSGPPSPRSKKRAKQMREYVPRMLEFLAEHEWCEFPLGCGRQALCVHHRRGRQGERLLDHEWWAASCVFHNDFAESHTGEALAVGWLIRIEGDTE